MPLSTHISPAHIIVIIFINTLPASLMYSSCLPKSRCILYYAKIFTAIRACDCKYSNKYVDKTSRIRLNRCAQHTRKHSHFIRTFIYRREVHCKPINVNSISRL